MFPFWGYQLDGVLFWFFILPSKVHADQRKQLTAAPAKVGKVDKVRIIGKVGKVKKVKRVVQVKRKVEKVVKVGKEWKVGKVVKIGSCVYSAELLLVNAPMTWPWIGGNWWGPRILPATGPDRIILSAHRQRLTGSVMSMNIRIFK